MRVRERKGEREREEKKEGEQEGETETQRKMREQESRSLAQRVYCRHDPSLCNLSQPLALHFSFCILRETQIC